MAFANVDFLYISGPYLIPTHTQASDITGCPTCGPFYACPHTSGRSAQFDIERKPIMKHATRSRFGLILGAVILALSMSAAVAAPLPSGERQLGQTIIEPAYNDATGEIIYLMTPIGAPFFSKANPHAWSPLYLIVYPDSAAASVGTMNCQHEGGDNCPDHGPDIAGLAASVMPSVYGAGVWGHDHILDAPGGSEFNVAWNVIVVLFTSTAAANTHITTEQQLDQAIAAGHAFTIQTPIVFNCNVVSAATYRRGTPLPPL
jgi:hypothetical protein